MGDLEKETEGIMIEAGWKIGRHVGFVVRLGFGFIDEICY